MGLITVNSSYKNRALTVNNYYFCDNKQIKSQNTGNYLFILFPTGKALSLPTFLSIYDQTQSQLILFHAEGIVDPVFSNCLYSLVSKSVSIFFFFSDFVCVCMCDVNHF